MQRALGACTAAFVAGVLASSGPSLAQAGTPLKSGLRGRVVIAPELASAKVWPVEESTQARIAMDARVRRPTGQAPLRPHTEPMPELLVVLEGARAPQKPEPRLVRVTGMRFVPAQLLVARPQEVRIENAQKGAITIASVGGEDLGTLEPGASGNFVLEEGEHELVIREMPFARAKVKVLPPSRFLPVEKGAIAPIAIESGDYQLAFYHGARALRVQSISLPEDKYLAIDAAVSANGVVTVSIKDGDLQVAVPPAPIVPPRPPPPRPAPAPLPTTASSDDGSDEAAPAPRPKPAPATAGTAAPGSAAVKTGTSGTRAAEAEAPLAEGEQE